MSGIPPASSCSVSSQSLSASSSTSSSAPPVESQSLRWSLQNFPVPVQLQARIPRSPLSVAQELLPNFPSQLMQRMEPEPQPQPYQMSLQHHIQQQLQQQFQRQLQLNLQGGGESSRSPSLPDPTDTILDMGVSEGALSTASGSGSDRSFAGGSSNNSGGLRAGVSSSNLLETFLRSAQAASLQQRNNSNTESNAGSALTSRVASAAHSHSHGHHHHHHHHNQQHQHSGSSHGLQMVGGRGGSGDDGSVASSPAVSAVGGQNGGPQGGSAASTAGANAGFQPPAELSLLYKWIAESGVFLLLLFLHFLYDHRLGLLVFLCMGGTFYYTNMKLVHAIHQSAVREQSRSWLGLLNLMWLCGFLMLNIVILYYVFSEQQLWRLLFFQMAVVPDISVWTLLWCVMMTDYIVKFLTVMAKSIVAMMQPCFKNYRRRGKYYLLMESISQLYRQMVTAVPWLYYLNDSTRTSVWFAFATEVVYLCFKSWSLWGSLKLFYTSFQRFSSSTAYGVKPSASELLERGGQCPICQDSVNEPVMLPCKHIFCEQCMSIWFDREKTCPMCRAEIITESPMWKDGNTSPHLQWH